jgi:hypothetical protein
MSEKKVKKLRRDVQMKTGKTLYKKAYRRLRAAYRATPGAARADFDVQPIVKQFINEDVARAVKIIAARRAEATAEFKSSKLKRAFKKIFGGRR